MTAPVLAPKALAGRVLWHSPEQVAVRTAELRAAQRDWIAIGARERARHLELFGRWMSANRDEIVTTMVSETGKSRSDASVEIPVALQLISYYGRNAEKFMAPEKRKPSSIAFANKRVVVHRRPYPVVGIISPWNYPIANPLMELFRRSPPDARC